MKHSIIASMLVMAFSFSAHSAERIITAGELNAKKCESCHGGNGTGTKSAPILAGKSKEEILLGFKKTPMNSIFSKMSNEDRVAVATYYSNLSGSSKAGEIVYVRDVLKIFKDHCTVCHSPGGAGTAKVNLDLTSYEGLMKGTGNGALVIPGSPETSSLYTAITRKDSMRMPLGGKLSETEIKTIWQWIKQGVKNN